MGWTIPGSNPGLEKKFFFKTSIQPPIPGGKAAGAEVKVSGDTCLRTPIWLRSVNKDYFLVPSLLFLGAWMLSAFALPHF
jgi:hypothetical protein